MNLEIAKKYDDFVKIIERKETLDKNNSNEICNCSISSGYTSSTDNFSNKSNKCDNVSTNPINSLPNYINNNININYENMSLLDDNFEIKIINNNNNNYKNNNSNSDNNSEKSTNTIDTIKSEFKQIFNNLVKNEKINIIGKNNLISDQNELNSDMSVKNKLEKKYNKILEKNIKMNGISEKKSNQPNYYLSKYIDLKKINNNEEMIKKFGFFCEKYLFEESTRGWNFISNTYIVNFDKLLENLKKIIFIKEIETKIGYFYRDYSNPKINFEKDFSKYWIGYEKISQTNETNLIKYSIKNKILYYSFKNLSESQKFKKRIGEYYYKIFKKTIQVFGSKDLIIDLIFYVGIKK